MQAKCRLPGCLGEYEQREIVRATRFQGRLIVIDGVPADVCSFCGDTLFRPDTAETLERFVRKPPAPVDTIPLYRYASLADAPVAPTGADTGSKEFAAGGATGATPSGDAAE